MRKCKHSNSLLSGFTKETASYLQYDINTRSLHAARSVPQKALSCIHYCQLAGLPHQSNIDETVPSTCPNSSCTETAEQSAMHIENIRHVRQMHNPCAGTMIEIRPVTFAKQKGSKWDKTVKGILRHQLDSNCFHLSRRVFLSLCSHWQETNGWREAAICHQLVKVPNCASCILLLKIQLAKASVSSWSGSVALMLPNGSSHPCFSWPLMW